jgi:hypothetical protein
MFASSPDFSFPRATRELRGKIHISREHDQLTPNISTPGPIYDIPSSLGRMHSCTFGKSLRALPNPPCDTYQGASIPSDATLNPSMVRSVSSISVGIGTEDRQEIRNAAVMKYNPQAFFGTESPGPATYSVQPKWGSPKYTIGSRTDSLGAKPQTSVEVGPGSYPHASYCGKSQFQSHVVNQPVYSFGKVSANASPDPLITNRHQKLGGSAIDSLGPQVSSKNPTAPRSVMGSQTREQWSKLAIVHTDNTGNPTIHTFRIPRILPRAELIKWSS